MNFRADDSILLQPGDFLARVENGELLVATRLALFAQGKRLATAAQLAGYADAFPSAVAESFEWPIPAVKEAVAKLMGQMLACGVLTLQDVQAAPARPYGFGSTTEGAT